MSGARALEVGLERLRATPRLAASWGRVGLLSNQASVTRDYAPAWQVLHAALGARLVALFGPQHGFAGTAQDNMIETTHARHLATGLPVRSLYSETREPTPAMLDDLDTLVIDLQIVGCRIYTWKSTIAGCLRAAKRDGKRIVVLDRPNPLGGELIEGRVLDDDAHSFVGQFPTPMRHGMTSAEAARFFNATIGAQLEVVELAGWDPTAYWDDLGRPWVLTSPNLPTPEPVYVYPGMVMLEGTNISEGRGTGLPFQLIGAPYVRRGDEVIARVRELVGGDVPGVHLREAAFEPTSQKWKGAVCNGFQLHVTDRRAVRSYVLGLAVIQAFMDAGGADAHGGFAWKEPPYEYDHVTLPIKLIVGSLATPSHFGPGFKAKDPFWHAGLERYAAAAQPYLLYPRTMRAATA
jgi:uncharacterized protein YbbC (DUF1343 family)